ncbi:hypothetical protein QRQ56_30520 [Bradyrhizobium sp. U531]|uniref:hypothetical protein n=1 Tax=Bradyrhizobium sp. U531 TaxID=3053458 RepID=UPI003F426274
MEGHAYSEFPPSEVGFPKGDSPEDFFANMMASLNEAAAKLERPAPPPVFSPAAMRDLSAIQEAMAIEQEVKKGAAGHPTVTARADLLRKDVWDRWRAGEGLPRVREPLAEAISMGSHARWQSPSWPGREGLVVAHTTKQLSLMR